MDNAEFETIAAVFDKEIEWLAEIIKRKEDVYNGRAYSKHSDDPIQVISPPDLTGINSNYANFINENKLSFEERLLLVLSFIPHLKPELLFRIYKDEISKRPQLGLVKGYNFGGIVPTGLTFLFLASGNTKERLGAITLLNSDSKLIKEKVLHVESVQSGDPLHCGKLIFSQAYFEFFTSSLQNLVKAPFHEN